jgi:hypothetical protein
MFILSENTAFHYLTDLGLCNGDRPPIEVLPLPGKNLNLHLKFEHSTDWLIKQETMDQHGCDDLFLGEWAVQDLINHTDRLTPLRAFIPPIVHYDRGSSILVSHFLEHHQSLDDYCESGIETSIASTLGQHLGMLHRLTFRQEADGEHLRSIHPALVPSQCPSEFSPLRPFIPEMFGWVRSDALTFFRWYQNQPLLIDALDSLSKTWSASCLTHQDLQLGNWLVHPESRSVQLIDWEHVGWGDPLTDVADLLTDPLQRWLSGLPPPTAGTWQERCDRAIVPFHRIQTCITTLVDAYFSAFPEALSAIALPRILQWVGRSLIRDVEVRIQYHRRIGATEANWLHFAQQLILYPEVFVSVFFD